MKHAFKKGDKVTHFGDWDRKGTAFFRHAIVHSCGLKQMILTDEASGEELGRNFRPVEATGDDLGTRKRMTDEEAIALCVDVLAPRILREERAHLDHCLTIGGGEAYDKAIRADIDKLHEPRALNRSMERVLRGTGA